MNTITEAIVKALQLHVSIEASQLEVPPTAELGDYALPCFSLARPLRQSPEKIAEDLSRKIGKTDLIVEVRNTGAYVNFFVNKRALASSVLSDIARQKARYGSAHERRTIMVEFSSPNTNKPLHLGHVRNIVIGSSISTILSFCGNTVVKSCLVNDRGIHITKSMLSYERWGKGKRPDKKSDHFVGDFYVLFAKKLEEDATLEQSAQELLRLWEQGDLKVISLWKRMNRWAEKGFAETYRAMDVKFDHRYYESEIYDKGKSIVEDAYKRKLFTKVDGAITAVLKPYGLPDKVVMRADGTSLYITQDIYLAQKKFMDYPLDESIYVVGSEQNLHFLQLFKILELLTFAHAKDCYHLSYGMVYLPEGRMKSREGTVVDADDLIAEMETLARTEIMKRHTTLSAKEVARRAHVIGLGALKFYMLKTDAARDMTFDPNESISFEGETGPYVQYAYARIASILRKYKRRVSTRVDFSAYGSDEMPIIKLLMAFPDVLLQSRQHHKPSLLCRHLLDLSQGFNEYYHKVPILKSPEKERNARLLLISCVQQVLKTGLTLLNIDVLEQM